MLDANWGYDRIANTTSHKIHNKREGFTIKHAFRLQSVQIECTDALRIIRSRDSEDTFVYCDPPYFNSDCGHYDGYSREDFENLLHALEGLKGKFLLSSYPSDILETYIKRNGWYAKRLEQTVTVAQGTGSPGKKKIEAMTANYDLDNPSGTVLRLFY